MLYANSSVFVISLIPMFVKYMAKGGVAGMRRDVVRMWHEHKQRGLYNKAATEDEEETTNEGLVVDDNDAAVEANTGTEQLDFRETFLLSVEFCMLWFGANYFASACLEYTSVASATILSSTSSIWTLILCAIFGVERFTLRKLGGVTSSLIGIVLISTIDLSGGSDENRGSFPHKSPSQIAKGDLLALLSAVLYGVYVTVMKRRVSNEERVNMRLFFGLVGGLIMFCLWPLFFILHWTNIEPVSQTIGRAGFAANCYPSLKCHQAVKSGPSSL